MSKQKGISMDAIIKRFASRKFLLTIAGIALVIGLPEHADNIVQIIGMFVGAEGLADVVERYKKGTLGHDDDTTVVSYNDEDGDGGVDTTTIVTGNDTPLFDEELKKD